MLFLHQLVAVSPQVVGVLAVVANVALGISIKRDPKAQFPLTMTAIAVTVLAASILFLAPGHLRSTKSALPDIISYPSTTPPVCAPRPVLRQRSL